MPTSLAYSFVNSISNLTAGNQGIVEELTNVLNLDVKTVAAQQTNSAASDFIQLIFAYYSQLRVSYGGIVTAIQQKTASFNNQVQIDSSEMFFSRTDDTVNSLIKMATLLADTFQKVSEICFGIQTEITSQPSFN